MEEGELCAVAIPVEHERLLEPDARRVFCACGACGQLFAQKQQRQGASYLRVERRTARLHELDFDDATWLVRRSLCHHDYLHVSIDHCYESSGLTTPAPQQKARVGLILFPSGTRVRAV